MNPDNIESNQTSIIFHLFETEHSSQLNFQCHLALQKKLYKIQTGLKTYTSFLSNLLTFCRRISQTGSSRTLYKPQMFSINIVKDMLL